MWMLTGDKVDTAINIGFSCSLLTTDMELLRLVADDGDMALDEERVPVQDAIENAFTQLLSGRTHQERALVVDTGAWLRTASWVPVHIRHDAEGLHVTHNGKAWISNYKIREWYPPRPRKWNPAVGCGQLLVAASCCS